MLKSGTEDARAEGPADPTLADQSPPEPPRRTPTLMRRFDSLSNPEFRLLWIGMLSSASAMQMLVVSRNWLAFEISGSALAIGFVALARGLPMASLTLVGGVTADRFDKRLILGVVQVGMAIVAVIHAGLVYFDVVEVWHLIVLGPVQGMLLAFMMPARQAMIPHVVSKEQLPNALALNSSGMNLNQVVAPAIAGVLLAFDPAIAFSVVAAMWMIGGLLLIRLPAMRPVEGAKHAMVADVKEGLRYVMARSELLGLLGMGFVIILLGMPFQQLLPVFQKEILHVGPSSLGIMYTAIGLGGLAGSLAIAFVAEHPRRQGIQMAAGITFGLLLVLFAMSRAFPVSLGLLVLIGLVSHGYMTLNSLLIMSMTSTGYYGRVMSIQFLSHTLMPLMMLPYGLAVDTFGAPTVVMIAGMVLSLLLTAFMVTLGRRQPLPAAAGAT